jgi:mono/diheme cytochrome c family protein
MAAAGVLVAAARGALRASQTPTSDGIREFVLGEFGGVSRATLETNALPYKVVATALLMNEERATNTALSRSDLPTLYRRFGFVFPTHIANWPAGLAEPRFERPIGTVGHSLSGPMPVVRVDAVTLGCATCHAGRLYGADGRATDSVWVGMPNTSIDLESYTQAVYRGLKTAMEDRGAFRSRVSRLFPEMGWTERFTLRYVLLPRIATRLREYAAAGDVPLPFSNGGPGFTNGVASLKHIVGVPPGTVSGPPDIGFTSIPDLSSRALRSSLLYDGVYAPLNAQHFTPLDSSRIPAAHVDSLAGIIAFFTVSTMGVAPDVGERAIPQVRAAVDWIASRYQSPQFPGAIDSTRMRAGEVVFARRCTQCHGTYADGTPRMLVSFPNRLVPQSAMGSDSARWVVIDDVLMTRLGATAYARHMSMRHTGGYVAPILSGLWATAPYLHNGSVPTLWQFLNPELRVARFYVGGHALDFATMGIAGQLGEDGVYAYPSGYAAWSTPQLYDTSRPGMSNRGHERQLDRLSADDKRALIEYLKTL